MKHQFIVPSCLLLVWTLTAFVSCEGDKKPTPEIIVSTVSDGIKVKCKEKDYKIRKSGTDEEEEEKHLIYQDDNSGEYECVKGQSGDDEKTPKIFVKFRTCDNCIELDIAAIMGIVFGELLATTAVGFGIYLITAHAHSGQPATSRNKASDRQHLVPHETGGSSNDHYQQLRHKGRKDEYDVITSKRR